ncbi:MAG: hypothetical protein AB7I27_18380 [Bacteriovoracaceae bacterium]
MKKFVFILALMSSILVHAKCNPELLSKLPEDANFSVSTPMGNIDTSVELWLWDLRDIADFTCTKTADGIEISRKGYSAGRITMSATLSENEYRLTSIVYDAKRNYIRLNSVESYYIGIDLDHEVLVDRTGAKHPGKIRLYK